MPLTADQRAMLQLMLERRQSYEDIGSLLGVPTEEVRTRARTVLTEMGGADPDAEVGLTDYLLGQADPIGRADAARHLQADPEALDLAQKLIAQLQMLAPDAQFPDLPTARARPAAAKPAGKPGSPAPRTAPGAAAGQAVGARLRGLGRSIGERQPRVLAALIASTLLVVVVVLAASGVFGGDAEEKPKEEANVEEVPVALSAPGGGDRSGRAVFANLGGETEQIAFRIASDGLEPSPSDNSSTYTIWLYVDNKHAYPLSPVTVPKNGKLSATRPIPALFTSTGTGLAVLARFQEVRLSLTGTKELSALVTGAVRKQEPLVPYIGKTVLQGPIPGSVGPGGAQPGPRGGQGR